MNIAPAITTQLLNTSGVTAIVGTRIYPEYDRQADKVYPLAVYKVENVTTYMSNQGPTGFETADYVIAVIGETYADADAVASAIQTALDGSRGTWSGVTIQGVFLKDDGVSDDVVTEPQTEEILFYTKELTFSVSYNK